MIFGVVLLTAIVYGFSGTPMAKLLGVRSDDRERLDDDGLPVLDRTS